MMNRLLLTCKLVYGGTVTKFELHFAIRFGADNEGLISTYGTSEDKQQLVSVTCLFV